MQIPLGAQAPCLTETVAARNALRFPELARQRELQQKRPQAAVIPDRAVVTIPVVVHVVYYTAIENITDDQIQSQLAVLNEDYRKQNANAGTVPALFAPLAADVEIEFCLASRDPGGNTSTGITRHQTSWPAIGLALAPDGRPRINYTALGGTDAWDPIHYLNIWVCGLGGGVLGFGTPPGTTIPAEDGLVIDPRYFGRTGLATQYPPNHLGRTATHEIGHYFNLRHIWGGTTPTCDDDDDVDDTPVQRTFFQGCPAFPQYSCGNSAMFMNYMDYTDDACMSLFTLGQKARMRTALTSARPGLMANSACQPGTPATEVGQDSAFAVFPNPAADILQLRGPAETSGMLRITITDWTGKYWFSSAYNDFGITGTINLPVASLPAGWYAIQCSGPRVHWVKTFIKGL